MSDQNRAEGRMNRTHDELSKVLEEMGGSAEEVAATLRAAGVQGVRNTVRVLTPSSGMSRTCSAMTTSTPT
jgi:hypothetical protein